jgi:hypothetical protein
MRKRTKTATQRDQDGLLAAESSSLGSEGGASGEDGTGGEGEEEEEGEGEEEFSDMLADAILKRPESIRGRSFRRKDNSRGKVVTGVGVNGTGSGAVGGMKKIEGEADVGGGGAGEEDENEDGWIRDAPLPPPPPGPNNVSQPVAGSDADYVGS